MSIWTLIAYILGIATVILYRRYKGVIEGWLKEIF